VAPSVFLLLVLAALVLLPFANAATVRSAHDHVGRLAEPARAAVTDLHVAMALEGSVLGEYVETRDSALLRRYRAAREQDGEATRRLATLVTELGGSVRTHRRLSATLALFGLAGAGTVVWLTRRLGLYATAVEQRGLQLREAVEGRARLPGRALRRGTHGVVTDGERVRQVLGNLLSNDAQGGTITVGTAWRQRPDAQRADGWIAVEVGDTGPGVPEHLRETIFAEFSRLPEHEGKPGVGLGLAIARRVARLLDGDLTVRGAASGSGACFTRWLPATRHG
jgi:signal transduction histidine kinase